MKKIKQYPWENKRDFIIAFYLIAEHSGKYFFLFQQLLQDMENELITPIKKCLFDIMVETNTFIEGDEQHFLSQIEKEGNKDLVSEANRRLKITYKKYKSIEERLSNNTNVLLNDFGDLSQGVSYYKLRNSYKKVQKSLGLPLLTDDEEVKMLLKKCNSERNYLHHFTEPKLLAWRQYREQQLEKKVDYIWPPKDIEIEKESYMNVVSVLKTHELYYSKFCLFNCLHFCLRRDYSTLIGEKEVADLKYTESNSFENGSAWDISGLGSNLFLK